MGKIAFNRTAMETSQGLHCTGISPPPSNVVLEVGDALAPIQGCRAGHPSEVCHGQGSPSALGLGILGPPLAVVP